MEWLPKEADFLTVFGAVLAAGLALLGLVAGLNQFSNNARARRLIEWTSEALASEKNTNRRTVLENLKLRGQGHLIAGHLIPWWRFSETILWTLLAPVLFIIISRDGDVLSIITVIASNLTLVTLLTRRSIKFYAERIRVEHHFLMGKSNVEPTRADALALTLMQSRKKGEFILSFLFALSVLITSGLLAWALTEGQDNAIGLWVIPSLFGCWSCLTAIRSYAKKWAQELPSHNLEG